ncbi:hypothetical protein LTR56_008758 [Elasticomyces elasticus]|nr:hypothetical protein LTR22_017543 [Elasticomyces elasticus]KAK3646140.1 hypothetical protein LTR56_008758 [Elasticomyces elasticus]KAK4924321.1 hypothetical protein LTR49_008622 [Elasticomyces elasticus]
MSNKIDVPPLRDHYRNKQYNIHPALFAPTNAYFYDGEIESMDDASKFELPAGWDDMLRTLPGLDSTISSPDGLGRRSRWFAIAGDNVQMFGVAGPGELYSSANWQHHLFAVGTLLPALRKLYGNEMFWKVTLVVPYERQRRLYKDESDQLIKHGLEQCELPDVWTVTAADHHEKLSMTDVVILDLVKSRKRPNGSQLASSNAVDHYKRYYAYFGLVVPFKPAGKPNLEELPWYLQPVVITPKMQEWIDLAENPALALRERDELEQRRKDVERVEMELQATARKGGRKRGRRNRWRKTRGRTESRKRRRGKER